MNRRRTDILEVGEPTLEVGEQTVGETTRRRNDSQAKRPVTYFLGCSQGEFVVK